MSVMSVTQRVGYTIIWKIENFNLQPKLQKNQPIESLAFTADNLDRTSWRLILFPVDYCRYNKDSYHLHLEREYSLENKDIILDYELSILSSSNSEVKSVIIHGYLSEKGRVNDAPFPEYLSISPHEIFGKREILPGGTLTIQCKMWYHEKLCLEPGFSLARSRISAERKSFVWNIDKFSTLVSKDTKSVTVEIRPDLVLLVEMTLYFTGIPTFSEKIRINVKGITNKAINYIILLGISFENMKGKTMYYSEDEFSLSQGVEEWRFPLVLDKNQLISNKDLLLPDDKLSLKCDFVVSEKDKILHEMELSTFGANAALDLEAALNNTIFGNEVHSGSNSLAKDLKHLFEEKTLADVSLVVHPEEFQVHKAILAARSPVFETLFETEMKEKLTNTLEISDFEPDIIRRLLLYIYNDTLGIDIQWENASKLYLAADKYAIIGLKERCSSYLKANLSLINMSEIFLLADMLEDKDLKNSVLSFIEEEDKVVLNSNEWEHFTQNHPDMAIDILTSLYRNVKQF